MRTDVHQKTHERTFMVLLFIIFKTEKQLEYPWPLTWMSKLRCIHTVETRPPWKELRTASHNHRARHKGTHTLYDSVCVKGKNWQNQPVEVTEVRVLMISEEESAYWLGKGMKASSRARDILCILLWVVFLGMYTYVKTHQAVHVRLEYFTICTYNKK